MKAFRLGALVVLATVLAAAPPTLAAGRSVSGAHQAGQFQAHQAGQFQAHRGFDGHPGVESRGVHGRGDGDRDHRPRRVIVSGPSYWVVPSYGWGVPYDGYDAYTYDAPAYTATAPYAYGAPAYAAPSPSYWYYCPSYGAYYPNVVTCPDAWVAVPAS